MVKSRHAVVDDKCKNCRWKHLSGVLMLSSFKYIFLNICNVSPHVSLNNLQWTWEAALQSWVSYSDTSNLFCVLKWTLTLWNRIQGECLNCTLNDAAQGPWLCEFQFPYIQSIKCWYPCPPQETLYSQHVGLLFYSLTLSRYHRARHKTDTQIS